MQISGKSKTPMLLFHGKSDRILPVKNSEITYKELFNLFFKGKYSFNLKFVAFDN